MTEDVRRELDELAAQRDLDALLDQVERGAEFLITRRGKIVARLLAPWAVTALTGAAAFSAPPAPGGLAEAIRRRFASVGGVDDLELPPREPAQDPPDFSKPVDGHMRHEPEKSTPPVAILGAPTTFES